VGGWLLERYSWAAIFIAMVPVAAAAVILVALTVPTSRDPGAAAVDIPGLVLSSATMALVVFTIIEAPTYGWTAGRSLAGFTVSAVLLAAFIAWERRAAHPMLEVGLFRNMRFSAASGAVTVSFFTLFGFIFLITQYFQFVRGYGPLSTGVRLLPVALAVGVGSVAGTQLAVRAGTKLIVTTGLVATVVFYGWVAATISATLAYGIIAAQMVIYGLGLGLTSAPATESIMGAISRAKAGVGSAINDSTRLIGGTLGVAVIGSVYASVYASRLTATMPTAVPGRAAAIAHQSVGAAYLAAGKITALGHPALGQALHHVSTNAFLRGLTIGALVAGGVAALGAVLAVLFLPAQPATPPAYEAETAAPALAARPLPALHNGPPARVPQPSTALAFDGQTGRRGNHTERKTMTSPDITSQNVIDGLDSFYCHNIVVSLWADAVANRLEGMAIYLLSDELPEVAKHARAAAHRLADRIGDLGGAVTADPRQLVDRAPGDTEFTIPDCSDPQAIISYALHRLDVIITAYQAFLDTVRERDDVSSALVVGLLAAEAHRRADAVAALAGQRAAV
jgi:ferritin-like protein